MKYQSQTIFPCKMVEPKSVGPGVSSDVLMQSCGSTRLSDLDGP